MPVLVDWTKSYIIFNNLRNVPFPAYRQSPLLRDYAPVPDILNIDGADIWNLADQDLVADDGGIGLMEAKTFSIIIIITYNSRDYAYTCKFSE